MGFLLAITLPTGSDASAVQIPVLQAEPLKRAKLGERALLITWGSVPGDVHYAIDDQGQLLLMCGYLSGAPGVSDLLDQDGVCRQLLTAMRGRNARVALEETVQRAHGSFAVLHLDAARASISMATDRINSRPLWLGEDDHFRFVSSHAVAVASAMRNHEYDPVGLGSLLLYSSPVDPTRSLFSGVRSVREGTLLCCDGEGRSEARAWYRFAHRPEERADAEWVTIIADRMKEAAAALLSTCQHPMLFLSGGVDSRLTASALLAAGGQPLLVTLGDSLNLEVSIARRTARAFGCQHQVMLRDPHWYHRNLRRAVFASHGVYSWRHSHFHEAYTTCQAEYRADAALLGDFCEAFSKLFCSSEVKRDDPWSEEEFLASFDSLHLPLYRPADREATLRLLRGEVRDEVERQMLEAIRSRYQEARSVAVDPKILADYIFRWQTAGSLATFQMLLDLREAGPERSIMFDARLHQLLEVLPSAMRDNKNSLGAQLVRKLHPIAGRVVNSNTLLPLWAFPWAHKLVRTVRPRLGRLRRRFGENSHRTTASWSLLSFLYTSDAAWRKTFEEVLFDSSLLPDSIFSRREIEQCWDAFVEGDHSKASDLERLLQLGLLRRSA